MLQKEKKRNKNDLELREIHQFFLCFFWMLQKEAKSEQKRCTRREHAISMETEPDNYRQQMILLQWNFALIANKQLNSDCSERRERMSIERIVCLKWSIKISTVCDQSRFHGCRRSIFTPTDWATETSSTKSVNVNNVISNKINDYTVLHSRARTQTQQISDQYLVVVLALPLPLDKCIRMLDWIRIWLLLYICAQQDAMTSVERKRNSSRKRRERASEMSTNISKHKQDDGDKKKRVPTTMIAQQHSNWQ